MAGAIYEYDKDREYDVHILCPEDTECKRFTEQLLMNLEGPPHHFRCAAPYRDWPPGGNRFELPYEFMRKSRVTIFLLCDAFLKEFGVLQSVNSGKIIIIQIDNCEVPEPFRTVTRINYNDEHDREHMLRRIVMRIKRCRAYTSIPGPPSQVTVTSCHTPTKPEPVSEEEVVFDEWDEDGKKRAGNTFFGHYLRKGLAAQHLDGSELNNLLLFILYSVQIRMSENNRDIRSNSLFTELNRTNIRRNKSNCTASHGNSLFMQTEIRLEILWVHLEMVRDCVTL